MRSSVARWSMSARGGPRANDGHGRATRRVAPTTSTPGVPGVRGGRRFPRQARFHPPELEGPLAVEVVLAAAAERAAGPAGPAEGRLHAPVPEEDVGIPGVELEAPAERVLGLHEAARGVVADPFRGQAGAQSRPLLVVAEDDEPGDVEPRGEPGPAGDGAPGEVGLGGPGLVEQVEPGQRRVGAEDEEDEEGRAPAGPFEDEDVGGAGQDPEGQRPHPVTDRRLPLDRGDLPSLPGGLFDPVPPCPPRTRRNSSPPPASTCYPRTPSPSSPSPRRWPPLAAAACGSFSSAIRGCPTPR